MANKKKDKPTIYVITGTDIEVHEVKDSNELNTVFVSIGITKPIDSNSPGIDMYSDDAEQFMAFVMRGGKPVQLGTSIEFHLEEIDDG